jgi:hypothetical protein
VLERRRTVTEVKEKISGLLGGPRSVGVGGNPEDVEVAGFYFEGDQHVEPPQCHGVDVEEVDSEGGGRLNVQELPPTRVAAAGRRRGYPGPFEDPADRRGGDPVTELAQLTLEALVAPRGVVSGQPFDEQDDFFGQRWAAGAVRVGPLPRDEAAMPAQDRSRGDKPVVVQCLRQPSDQRGQDRPSAQSSRGLGLPRRSTATSCRNTSSSASFDAVERASSTSQPASRMKIR